MPVSGAAAATYFEQSGSQLLDIKSEHATAIETLPNYQQDPFDRLLVAQALTEPMRLMTHDSVIPRYSDTIIRI